MSAQGTIRIREAAERLRGVVERTELASFDPGPDAGPIELRLKLECTQVTGSFKPRGAWNNIATLTPEQRAAGVVASSSGNHGLALSWAAQRGGVKAAIFMPEQAYPNKIQACRDYGAEVVLAPDRVEAERLLEQAVAAGSVLIHPYDAERTVEGAGTVGLEIAEDWPEVELVVVPVGGGGLIAGTALALRENLDTAIRILGVEPAGAPSMTLGLAAGKPVELPRIQTEVQGLCPLQSGQVDIDIVARTVDRVLTLPDREIFAAQARLVREGGWTVEPAGAAAAALVLGGHLADPLLGGLLAGRSKRDPLRVCVVVSGGNPDPAQLEQVKAGA